MDRPISALAPWSPPALWAAVALVGCGQDASQDASKATSDATSDAATNDAAQGGSTPDLCQQLVDKQKECLSAVPATSIAAPTGCQAQLEKASPACQKTLGDLVACVVKISCSSVDLDAAAANDDFSNLDFCTTETSAFWQQCGGGQSFPTTAGQFNFPNRLLKKKK